MKKLAVVCLTVMALVAPMTVLAAGAKEAATAGPVTITMFYSDNATLPFKADWLTVTEAQKRTNAAATHRRLSSSDQINGRRCRNRVGELANRLVGRPSGSGS